MGVGLPYAIGACVAHPDKPVVCVTGDGSIQMNIQELATAKQLGVAPKIILLNNNYLGMVRQWQELEYDRRYSHSHMEVTPDFKPWRKLTVTSVLWSIVLKTSNKP